MKPLGIIIFGELVCKKTTIVTVGGCGVVETTITDKTTIDRFIDKYCFHFDPFLEVFDNPDYGEYWDSEFPELYDSEITYDYANGFPELRIMVDPYDYYTHNPNCLGIDDWIQEELVEKLADYLNKKAAETPYQKDK